MKDNEFILLAKEHGIDVALSISAREDNKDWKCPVCKSEVKITSQESYETLLEHVEDPNKFSHPNRDAYRCINQECICNDPKHNVFWNYHGEMYGGFYIEDEDFIGENNAPFGSIERKFNIEIHKKGYKDCKYLSPLLCLGLLQPYIEYHYKADVMGNVVKRWFSIKFLKKSESGDYSYGFTTCWSTWKYLHYSFSSQIKFYKKNKNLTVLKEAFKPSFNRSWDVICFENIIKILYWKYYKKIK
jgi:hypothetical protein